MHPRGFERHFDRLAAEYSGTALTAVFKQPVGRDPQLVRDTVRRLYADTGRTLL